MTRPMPGPRECECLTCEGCAEERHEGLMHEGEPCPACHVHAGPSHLEQKRLTDGECAAHYWQAFCYRARALAEIINLPPHEARRIVKESDTWHRFDTHPHALEATP